VEVAWELNEMAVVLRVEGRPDSAVAMLRQALAINRKLQGDDELGTLVVSVNLGRALEEARQYAEAEKFLRGALAKLDTSNADAQMGIIPGRTGMGRVLLATHRVKEAVPVIEGALEMSRKRFGADHWRTGEAQLVLAECLMAMGEVDSAEAPLREGRAVLDKQQRAHPGLAREANAAGVRFAALRLGRRREP
jgi:tetratricopeptide (TPR) repeat protein